jgi:hypothetical protein
MSSLLKPLSIFSTATSTDVVFVTLSSTAAIFGTAFPASFAASAKTGALFIGLGARESLAKAEEEVLDATATVTPDACGSPGYKK